MLSDPFVNITFRTDTSSIRDRNSVNSINTNFTLASQCDSKRKELGLAQFAGSTFGRVVVIDDALSIVVTKRSAFSYAFLSANDGNMTFKYKLADGTVDSIRANVVVFAG